MLASFASRICGSSDLYHTSGKGPQSSINFITCHDGFTLNDLVSYARKHNEANGEDNRDGPEENYSANHGVEGEADDPAVEARRGRQIKNFLLTLAIARGVPMLLAGDEFRRTQRGNNNAYCQDNETSWVDWSLLQRHAAIFRFACRAFAFRQAHAVLRRESFYTGEDIQWFDPRGNYPDWFDPQQKAVACLVRGQDEPDLFLMFNADSNPIAFILPSLRTKSWQLAVDTALPSPRDFSGPEEDIHEPSSYLVDSCSSVVLVAG
jgi:glycogen operon protein